jgi:hypothetical protein
MTKRAMLLGLAFFFPAFVPVPAETQEPFENALPFVLKDERTGKELAGLRIYEVSRAQLAPGPGQTAPPTTPDRADKPLVLVEGFDIGQPAFGEFTRAAFEKFLRAPKTVTTTDGELQDFWDLLLAEGYDLYLVDIKSWNTQLEHIATLLGTTLEEIFVTRTQGREPFVVAGASLGGLVARLALFRAEQQGRPHNTRLYLSVDAPHRGAIIPLGIQRFLEFWGVCSEEAARRFQLLQRASVKQVLIRQLGPRIIRNIRNEIIAPVEFRNFQSGYQKTAMLSSAVEAVAFSNGSGRGEMQFSDPFGREMFHLDFDPTGIGDFDAKIVSFYEFGGRVRYHRSHCGRGPVSATRSSISDLFNIEAAPGGYARSYETIQLLMHDALRRRFGRVPRPRIVGDGAHSFVPVASGVDLNRADMTTREGVWDIPRGSDDTPFDRIHLGNINTEHAFITAYALALEAELLDSFTIDPVPSRPEKPRPDDLIVIDRPKDVSFRIVPSRSIPVFLDVQLATDPRLFNQHLFEHLRDDSNFFSSFLGGSSTGAQGSVAPPMQERVPPEPFIYTVPKAVRPASGLQW